MNRILIVDDQVKSFLKDVNGIYASQKQGFQFLGLEHFDARQLKQELEHHSDVTVVLLDIMDAKGEEAGIRLLEDLEKDQDWTDGKGAVQIVVFSQEATAQRHAVVARMKLFSVSGFLDKDEFFKTTLNCLNTLKNSHAKAEMYKRWPTLADPVRRECELVYSPNSTAMAELWKKILLAGRSLENVLIQGDTGTGKELVAKAIHHVMDSFSPEDIGELMSYNIASAPVEGNLLQVELFGAMPNSYSGASDEYTPGLFETAAKKRSPLFLDEIGDAPPSVQVALLRVLQEKEVTPLGVSREGGGKELPWMRLIAASNVRLYERTYQGGFREDLYYRLRGILIKVPPLRERKDDIPVLAYHFLDKLNEKYREAGYAGDHPDLFPKTIPPESEQELFERLMTYDWPGNVRELEMAINASYAMSPGNEFTLSKEVEGILSGKNPMPVKTQAQRIIDDLRAKPRSLLDLATDYSHNEIKEAMRYLVETLGRHPNDGECVQYFGPDANNSAFRQWASQHGIASPRGKKKKKS